jgi:hypothetical protein
MDMEASLEGLSPGQAVSSDSWHLRNSTTDLEIRTLLHANSGMDVHHMLYNFGSDPAALQVSAEQQTLV